MELSKADTTAIKGAAMLFMLWHHLFLFRDAYGVFAETLAEIFKVCVALFLFVSGYGLTKQYSKLERPFFKNTVKFLLKRYVGFFLPYWFCFVLVVVIGNFSGLTFHDAYPATRNTLKCVLLDAFGYMGSYSYLRTWWFNKMILQLYLVFPLLYMVVKNKYSAIIGAGLILIMQLNAPKIPGGVFFVVEGGTPAFFMGMVFAKYRILPSSDEKKRRIVGIIVSLVLCATFSLLHVYIGIYGYKAIVIRALLAVSIVCFFGYLPSCGQALGFVGKYATIMYLTHSLIQRLMRNVIYGLHYPVLIFMLFLAISLGAAVLIDWLQKALHYNKLKPIILNQIDKLI